MAPAKASEELVAEAIRLLAEAPSAWDPCAHFSTHATIGIAMSLTHTDEHEDRVFNREPWSVRSPMDGL